jgi:hypothetical protein
VIRVFLSYASEDRARVEILYQNLVTSGFEPWMDKHDLRSGAEWKKAIVRGVQSADCFLACISSHSIPKKGVLAEEMELALEQWKMKGDDYRLIPVRLEDIKLPEVLETLQCFDLFRDDQWTVLAREIRLRTFRLKPRYLATLASIPLLVLLLWIFSRAPRWPPGPVRIGVTLWLLRDATPADRSAAGIRTPSGPGWIPERAAPGRIFKVGDRVRASFESAQDGYLYIIDREHLSNGSFGTPKLIFPTQQISAGKNQVHAGQLIEVPPQDDPQPYWNIDRQNQLYDGEVLTILFARQTLDGFEPGPNGRDMDPAWWRSHLQEWDSPVTTTESRAGLLATQAEIEAGRDWSKILTHRDPLPQIVFAGTPKRGLPIVATFPIRISQ